MVPSSLSIILPCLSSRVCRLVWEDGGDPVPACDERLPAQVQEQADLVGR